MLDLDAAQGQLEEVWRNGWYPNSTVSSGVLLKTMDALIAELRKLREENARLEVDLDINAMKIRQLQAEHERICNEHALLVQESGREGRELDRLEGLIRAWVKARGDDESEASKNLWAEGFRLAKEKP